MKKVIVAILAVVVAPAVFAQGSFFYNNFADGLVQSTPPLQPADSSFQIDIFWGPIGTPEAGLVALGNAQVLGPFGPGSEGLYDGGTATIPTVDVNILVQYRAVVGGVGSSAIVTQPLAFGVATPADPVPNGGWTIVVPEPTTFALAGLGAAALLIFRRRD